MEKNLQPVVEKISPVVEKINPPVYAKSPLPEKNLPLFMGRAVLIKTYHIHVLYRYNISCILLRGRNIEYLNLCCSIDIKIKYFDF